MVKQIATMGQYASDMIHDRFQVMESSTNKNRYYIVVHDNSPDGFHLHRNRDDIEYFESIDAAMARVESLNKREKPAPRKYEKKPARVVATKPAPVEKTVKAPEVVTPEKPKVQFNINAFRNALLKGKN